MQAFFLKTLSQKCGPYVSIQLLQTLNILFENIRNETSLCESTHQCDKFGYFLVLSLAMCSSLHVLDDQHSVGVWHISPVCI